ncbi:MAG TPA: radical SAM protein [Candidatus Binatia bacterium]
MKIEQVSGAGAGLTARGYRPEEVIVEAGSEQGPIFENLRRSLADLAFTFVERADEFFLRLRGAEDPLGMGKRYLLLTRHQGDFIKKCPGSEGSVCCNYFVINFASNCPMECSYCYLQDYPAHNTALKIFSNVEDLLGEARSLFARQRGFFFRVGTGEITDSLALDPFIGFSEQIVPFFAEQPNALLELKTKSRCVDRLVALDPKDRVVASWSMNPQAVIDADEHGTASFEERIEAARRCQEAGYRLGFHFDPMVEYANWEEDYRGMVEKLFSVLDPRRMAWISLGVLRTTPNLKRIMRGRFPASRLISGEQVLAPDGKLRYFHPLRVSMYRKMLRWIRQGSPTVFVYLCMESKEVWEQVFGFSPSCEMEIGRRMTAGM